MGNSTQGFTGRQRRRRTSRLVTVSDSLARALITLGGIGTILSVMLVCVFLVWVAVPLFLPTKVIDTHHSSAGWLDQHGLRVFTIDEYQLLGVVVLDDGRFCSFRLEDGSLIAATPPPGGKTPTAWSFSPAGDEFIVGYDDGSIQLGAISFSVSFPNVDSVDPALRDLPVGKSAAIPDGLISRTPEGQFRKHMPRIVWQDPIAPLSPGPVLLVDRTRTPSGEKIAMLGADGKLRLRSMREQTNFLTGQTTIHLSGADLPYEPKAHAEAPSRLLLNALGDNVLLLWEDGKLIRYDCRNPRKVQVAETLDVVESGQERLTVVRWLNGRTTLVTADSAGRVRTWFRIRPDDHAAGSSDGSTLVAAHEFPARHVAATALAISQRSRMLGVGYADGHVRLFHVTSEKLLLDHVTADQQAVSGLALGPKDNALVALAGPKLARWHIDPRHPEVTLYTVLMPVWYDGFNRPVHKWETSAGTDSAEPKFGLMPLIFGTIKATVYSMLFGLPIALLAAIYTSEFLHPSVKAWVKPLIEMMASLPSVVLGFLALVLISPFVEDHIAALLAAMVLLPVLLLFGAYAWQLLPRRLALSLDGLGQRPVGLSGAGGVRGLLRRAVFLISGIRLLAPALMLTFAVVLSAQVGPRLESLLFAGDIKRWLDGQIGTGVGGWMIMLLPVSALLVAIVMALFINPALLRAGDGLRRQSFALLDLGKFLAGFVAAVLLALLVSMLLTHGLHLDPRGGVIGTFDQRNALVVGFVMGFAIIPIIYTIAEDALSAVPEHLRSASLGAGATPWQTATRVIVPTAMSGLFSATMIGLGRAVGETMIVLMAAGNNPIMDWNIFNGMSTLSARIATEMPEAAKNSTHYRTLFLAALALFAMTFVINTVAESVRQRFRRRAFQL